MFLNIGGIFRGVELDLHILFVYADNDCINQLVAATINAPEARCHQGDAAHCPL